MKFKEFLCTFLCVLIVSVLIPHVFGTELQVAPIADTSTDSQHPDVNYGRNGSLYCLYYKSELTSESWEYDIWLKFSLSGVPAEARLNSIILRMRTFIIATTGKIGVFLCLNSEWKETELTWNTSPRVTGEPIDTKHVDSSNAYYDFNVTSAVEGKGVITFVLKTLEPTTQAEWIDFGSKEFGLSSYHPKLVVEYVTPSFFLTHITLISMGVAGIVVIMVLVYIFAWKKKHPSSANRPTIPKRPE